MTATETATRCRRCNRKLTGAKSIASGYGPTCAKRMTADTADFTPEQVAKALQVIADGGVARIPSKHFHGLHMVRGTYREYHASTTDCGCAAGQEGRLCYHVAAVRLAAA
ncbi:DUF6011 domain-containing protein [Frankia sp. AgB32]|uniref:DUF6011 domain-containing protein n=1 Tax=Frankia sp. AgB32 TaxID=631119 RepID=UPI00200F02BE|nr:DUF6011 domain-containing protein [Frankia sp. AgB32]MCK9898126.1 DUF6011 domain-containing protein [Frankia sp. AgB32]